MTRLLFAHQEIFEQFTRELADPNVTFQKVVNKLQKKAGKTATLSCFYLYGKRVRQFVKIVFTDPQGTSVFRGYVADLRKGDYTYKPKAGGTDNEKKKQVQNCPRKKRQPTAVRVCPATPAGKKKKVQSSPQRPPIHPGHAEVVRLWIQAQKVSGQEQLQILGTVARQCEIYPIRTGDRYLLTVYSAGRSVKSHLDGTLEQLEATLAQVAV